jgi:hypothetical protein
MCAINFSRTGFSLSGLDFREIEIHFARAQKPATQCAQYLSSDVESPYQTSLSTQDMHQQEAERWSFLRYDSVRQAKIVKRKNGRDDWI